MEEGKKKYSEEILRGISKVKKEYANRDKARKQKQQAQGVKLGDELSKYTNDNDFINSFGRGPEKELDNSVYDGLKSFSEKNFQSFTQNKTNFDKQKYSRKLSPAESVFMGNLYGLSGNEFINYKEDFYKYPFVTNEEKILANNVYAGFHNGNAISNLPLFEKLVNDETINDYNISLFTNNKSFTKEQKKKWQDLYIQARNKLRTIKGREIDQQIKSVKDNPNIPKVNKNAIIHELNNAKEQLDAADGGNVIYDWLKGVGNHLSDSDFWTVGITEFARNKKIQNASEEFNTNYNKYIKQGLSEEEASARAYQDLPDKFKAMFDAYATAIDVNQLTSNEISNAYKAGQTTADIIPLAVTMGAGSGANALIRSFFKGLKAAKTGSKIAGTIGKGLEIASKDGKIVKSFEKSQKAVQEAAKLSKMPIGKQIFKDYGKTLARGVEDAVTTTLISPKTYADLSLEKANANFSHDDFVVKDYIKSFGQSFIDNVTETSTGAFFSPATRYFNHLLKIKPNSALSKIFGGNNKMNKYFHFGGALEEISEEYAGAGLNVLLGYGLDDDDLKNSFKEFLSKDSQTVLFASILPATMIMGVVPNTLKDIHDSKRAKAYRNIKATLNNTLNQLGIDNGNITQAIEIAIASGQLENVTGKQKLFEAIDTVMQFVPQEKRQEVEGLLTNYFTAASKLNEDFKGFSKEFNSWDEAKKTAYINDLVETAQRQSENTIMYQQVRNGHYVTLNDENGQKQNYIVQVSSKDGNLGFVTNISHKTEEDKDGNVIDGEKIYEIVDEMGRTHQMTQEQILEANKGGENEGNLEKIFSFNNINEIYDYLYNQSEGNDQLRFEIQMRQLLNDFIRDNGYEKTLNAGTLKDGREVYFADADANSQTAVALVQNDNGQYEKQQINLSDIQEAKTTNVEDVINNANNIFTAVQKSVMPNITAIHNADMVQQVVEPTLTGQQGQQPTTATQTQGNEAQETVVGRSMTKDEANNSTNNSTNAAFEVGQTYSIGEIGNLQEGDKIELHNAEKYNSDMQGHELNVEQVNKGNIVVSYSPDESDPDVPRRTTKLIKNNRFLQGATFTYKGGEVRQQEQQQEQTTQEAITQQPTEQQTETHQAQGQTKVPLSDRIKSGEIMNNTTEQTLQELSEELDNDEEDVANVISSKIEELKNKISKTNKPKTSDIAKIKASKQKINHLQQQLDYWQKVQQQANKPTEQQSADETHTPQTTEEQKQSLNTLKTKFDSNKVKIGNKASKILPNGKKIKGTYILVEAGGVTASHNPNKGFSQSEDFPRREDGTTINDRDYQNDKAAQAQVRERANKYDGRAVQDVPIVDENGVVLSGNDRTMSGELAARQNTDGAYIEFLKENAAQFGFNEEYVASARHPRVVFVTDDQMPYTTETFAVFNQNERKSQNDTQKAIKISKVIKEKTLQRIAQIIDKHDTIAEVWSNKENVSDILKALVDDGLLTTNEVEQYVREDGLLSDTGKSFIETVLLGSVLKEETILKIGNEASLKAKIVSALAQLIKNRSLSQDYSLIDEINEAVLTIYDARKTMGIKYGDSLKAYYTQLGLFVDSNINSKTIMMLADILNANKIKELKNVLNSYNEMAQSSANGELDMFSQAVQSKEEILENILNQLGYGERNKQIDAISNSKESSRDNGTEPRNEQQGSDRRSQETTVARGEQRGEIKNTFLDDVKTFDKEQADSIVKKENTEEYLGNIVSAAKKEKKSPTDNVNEKKKNPSGNILVTDEMYEDLKKRMRAKLRGQFNVGIDPEILEIGIKMAVYHIERNSRKFIDYSKAMINDLGDEIRPYLKSFYNAVRDLPEMAEKSKEMDSYDEVSKFDVHNFDKEKKPDIINQAKQRVAEKKAVEEVKQAKKKLQERSENEQDLFSFSNGSTEKSVTLRDNNKKDIDNGIQGLSRDTTEKGTGRHVSNENGALGTSQSDAVEQTIKVGMDKSSIQSRSNDELGSRRVSEPSDKQKHDVKRNQRNFHNEPSEKKPLTVKGRLIANLEAVKLMKDILSQGREASAEEKKKLSLFTGWGGLGVYFSENNSEYQTIRDLLTDEEFDAAVSSLNTAFYTPENIINSLWQIAEKFGFKGGKILEGSAGVGNIISQIPTSINEKSDIEAVEIDSVTGNILKLLYPDAKVNINGFEKTYVRPASIDLAITNVPFVTGLKVWDENNTDISKKFGDIHNFCIAKNVRSLREGGLGIFITSKGTLDNNTALIDWITSTNGGNADFVGAFRLNNKTFGGTNVTSDIIVIKKRSNGEISPNAINVSSISKERDVQLHINGEEKTLPLMYNTYFVEHPENMGGKMYFNGEKGETFRPTSMSLFKDDTNQDEQMKSWLDNLNKHQEEVITKPDNEEYKDYEKTDAQEGVLIIDRKGNICQSYQGRAIPIGVKNNDKINNKGNAEECLKDYQVIKQELQKVLDIQTNSSENNDNALKSAQKKLNDAYDNFVDKYGYLSIDNRKIKFLKNDVDFPSIMALEDVEEIKTIDKTGKTKTEYKVKKEPIFSQRVIRPNKEKKPENISDAVILSINEKGFIDTERIAQQLNLTLEQTEQKIIEKGLGFVNPTSGKIEVSYEYLSGNVREKLDIAKSNNTDGRYDKNIQALEKVLPTWIPAHLINIQIGASWVPVNLFYEYIKDRYDFNRMSFYFMYVNGVWITNTDKYGHSSKDREGGVYSEQIGKQIYASDIFLALLNNQTITVQKTETYYENGAKHTRTVTDKTATEQCVAKAEEMKEDFREWVGKKLLEDEKLKSEIETTYNNKFNNLAPKEISDEFLPAHFEGASLGIELYKHQKKAVMRALTEPLLLAHEVGTGKTFTMITTAMEMKRLKMSNKPMIVVQNATLEQFVSQAKKLYPAAKILSPSNNDKTKDGRQYFYSKVKYGQWDIIVVPQSMFNVIPDGEYERNSFMIDKINEKEQALLSLKQMKEENKGNFNDERIISQLEKDVLKLKEELTNKNKGITASELKKQAERKANAQAKAEKQLDRKTDEDLSTLKDMGVDALLVDEAHEYKRLGFETTIKKVRGIDQSSSKRATALFLKTKEILRRKGGKNVVFATGTPISNTAAEIWTFMKYLLPKEVMQESGIYYFDDFVRNFGKIAQVLEFSTNGKYRENTRFLGYNGLPELIRMWATISDTVLSDENAELNEKIPETELGAKTAQDIFLDQTQGLAQIMRAVRQELEEYENMKGKDKKNNSHIPLVMFGIAKRAAIDPRLVDENAADEPNSKTNQAVKEILRSLNETKSYKGTVAVFCDRFNRKATDTAPAFNLFEDIKQKLIKNGVNADEIFVMKSGMTDTAKSKVFDKVNSGDIRVIMGSTQLLGVGVNIQERLHTLIHMDAPDRPMDYEQRNGRILRQGNLHKAMNKRVRILRFGVKKSLDVSAYQRLKTKQAFIHSIMDGKQRLLNNLINREEDEINEEGIFDNPVAMLSGSQYALELNQAKRTYTKYKNKEKEYNQNQLYATKHIPENEKHIENNQKIKEKNEKRLEEIGKYFPNKSYNSIEIAGKKCTNIQQVEKVVKDKINKRITEKTEDIRKDYTKNTANLKYNIKIDDVPVELDVVLTKEMIVERGVMKNVIHKSIQMTSKDLNIENIPTFSQSVSGAIDFIINNIVTGDKIRKDLSEVNANITRYEKENKSLKDTLNKPFEFGEQLQKSKDNVERLTDLMNKEIAENEKEEERLLKESGEENVSLDKLIDSSFENEEDESGSTVQAEIKLNTNEEQGSNITGEERNNANEQEQALMNELEGILTNAGIEVISDNEEAQRILDRANGKIQKLFGGNSGYVGHSKSKRAVEAEERGLRNASQMDSSFMDEVNAILKEKGIDKKVSLKEIKDNLKEIRSDEWHHTSAAGNHTQYYSAETIADYFFNSPKYNEDVKKREELENRKSVVRGEIKDAAEKILATEEITVKAGDYETKATAFKSSNGLYLPVSRGLFDNINEGTEITISTQVYAKGDLEKEAEEGSYWVDSSWIFRNKERVENALKERQQAIKNALHKALEAHPELKKEMDEVSNAEKDIKIKDRVKLLKTPSGEVYGFTVGGKIYIDKSIATAETFIHEYTHLWAAALRKKEPKHWEKIVNLMKGTEQWEQVKETYKDLQTDDEIADEVLAHYSGKRGAERLREERKQATQRAKDDNAKVKAVISVTKIRAALKMFWKGVADMFGIHFTTAEEVSDRVLYDMLNGFNPNTVIGGESNGGLKYGFSKNREEFQEVQRKAVEENNINRELEGIYEEFDENGTLRLRANYKNGYKDGLYERWNEKGKRTVKSYYNEDKKVTAEKKDNHYYIGDKIDEKSTEQRRERNEVLSKEAEKTQETAEKTIDVAHESIIEKMFDKSGIEYEMLSSEELLDKAEEFDSNIKQVLATNGGVVYGFTVGGKIYLDRELAGARTKIHEYTHLWDKFCQKNNPDMWKQGVELMKQTQLWEYIKNSGLYDDLSEYDLASEIHARLVGKEGDNFLREMQQKAMEYGDNATVWKRLNVISKLKDWLRGFWKWVKGEQLGEKRAKEMNIDDFVNMPIMDLMNGTDIRYEVQSNDHYSVLQAEIEAEEEYGEELNRIFENLSRAERKHAKAGTITNAGDIAKGEQDGNQILPKRKKGITSKGTIVTNSVFQKAVLRYGGGWQWDEQKKKFVKKKNLLRGVDNFFDRFAPVRRMVTMCKLLGIDVINNPYYALVDADNVAKGLADVRIQPRVIQHYTAIQDIMKATGLTYDEVNNLLTIRSIPERTAKLIAREFDRIEKRVLLLSGETLSKLDGMEAEQIIDDLVATGKTDINKGLSEKEGVFAKNFLLCMEDINENELEDFVSQVQEKIIGGKDNSDEQEKWIRKSCARLMAARDYRDNYSYNTNTYEELDGIFKRYEAEELQKQGISGQIQGYGAEHDMYLTPLYQKLFGKNDKRTLHTPQEIIEKTEEIINKNEQSKEAYKKLTENIKKTVEEMNDFAVDNGVISEKLYNSFQINNGTWLPLRGWDADIYKVFGEDTANQKINEIARGRSRFPDNPLKYLYAEYDTTIRKAAFNNAKRFFVEFIHKYPELFIESNMTASSVVYKWKPNTENQKRYAKLIEKSKSLLKEDERDEGFVITRFRPAESEIDGKEDITQGILQNDDLERSQFLDEIKIFGEDYDAAYTKGNESLQKYIWTFRDGGVTHKIVLNDKTLVEILNSPTLKPKFASSKGINFIGKITRFLAMMMTSRNISFLLRNFARDFQEALFIEVPNVPQYRKNYAKYVWKDKGVLVDIIARPKDAQKKLEAFKEYKKTGILPEKYKGKEKEIDNWLDTYEEYNKWLEQGGATGYVYQFSNIGDHLKNYQKLAQQGDKNKVQKFLNDKFKNKQMKSVINAKTWDVIAKTVALKYIETLTEVEENLIRFASYRALKKGGLSDEEAAYQSREATVNFSRYGKGSKFFNTIFPFFGATINAMYRDARLLAHNPLNFMKRMSMYFTVGLVNSLAAGLIGGAGDEDDSKYKYVSEFMKLRGFYSPIPITGLDNWFIPVPQSVYPVYGAGVLFGQILKGEKNMKEAAVDEINLFLGMLPESISSPISGLLVYDKATDRIGINAKWGDVIMRALTSGALNPIYDLYRNENYMGSNIIYNDSPFKHKTRIARSKGEDKNYWMFEKAAEGYNIGLNRALYFLQNLITLNWSNLFMGISNEELEKLFMDSNGQYNGTKFHTIAPEDLQHLFEGYVPSFSQLVFKGVDLITGHQDATKLMNYPIVNAISSKPQKENRFWETVNALDEITEKWKKDKENMKNYTDKQRQKVQSNIGYKIFEDWSSQRKSVMARRKQLSETIKAIEKSKIYSEQQKRERTDKLYKQINSLNDNLIKKYNMVSLKENKWTTKDAINKITFGAVK